MARPRKEINKTEFEKLCGLQCTLEEIAGMCSVSNNMPWMIVQRRGACNLITADRILDALGYQLVIVKKEDDT